jgi:hypothetical protein
MGALLRFYSYIYHAAVAIVLFGIGLVAAVTHTNLKLDMLPWQRQALTHWLLILGLTGLISTVLAAAGRLRFLFLFYALAVFGVMFRCYFLTGYGFHGKDEFHFAVLLTAGALLAILGAWSQMRREKARKRR